MQTIRSIILLPVSDLFFPKKYEAIQAGFNYNIQQVHIQYPEIHENEISKADDDHPAEGFKSVSDQQAAASIKIHVPCEGIGQEGRELLNECLQNKRD